MDNPKISIITVVYNCVDTIEETILSVLGQTYRHFEYLIIDGASTDGTLEVLDKYKADISQIISEKDKGLYDAMNKGMIQASGDFCMFLNAGDVLYKSSTLADYSKVISDPEKIYFGTAVMTDRKNIYRLRPPESVNIEDWLSKGNIPNHQSMLFPRSFYQSNQYDLSFKTASDDDFKMRALKKHQAIFIPTWTILFELGGVSRASTSIKKIIQRNNEVKLVNAKNKGYKRNFSINYVKYVIKSILLWILTSIFGEHYKLELYFNKFQKIKNTDKAKFQPKF